MNIVININDFDFNRVSFYNPIKNKVKKYENFYKIIYNCNFYTITTLIINIPLKEFIHINNHNKNYIICFSCILNEKLIKLENDILKRIYHFNNDYVIKNEITNTTIITKTKINNIYLRIYGVWNNYNDIGLVYRFLY